jgi:hypothetical protein
LAGDGQAALELAAPEVVLDWSFFAAGFSVPPLDAESPDVSDPLVDAPSALAAGLPSASAPERLSVRLSVR